MVLSDAAKQALAGILLLALGAAVGRYSLPAKTITTDKIVYQDKIVEKIVYKEVEKKKDNTVTIRLVTIKPDGTKTIETRIYDKNEIDIVQNKTDDKTQDVSKVEDKSKIVINSKNDWLISGAAKILLSSPNVTYGAQVNRRVLGPIYLGAFGFLDSNVGVSLGLGF